MWINRPWVLHSVSLWNTSVLWEQSSVTCPHLFPLKIPGWKCSLLERPGLTDKLSHEPKDCFSKAFVFQVFQVTSFKSSACKLFRNKADFVHSAPKHLLCGNITVVVLCFILCFQSFQNAQFQIAVVPLPSCSLVPGDSGSLLKEIKLPGINQTTWNYCLFFFFLNKWTLMA